MRELITQGYDENKFTWATPTVYAPITPTKPLVAKLPMKMEFIDSIGQIFRWNKQGSFLEYLCSTYKTFSNE